VVLLTPSRDINPILNLISTKYFHVLSNSFLNCHFDIEVCVLWGTNSVVKQTLIRLTQATQAEVVTVKRQTHLVSRRFHMYVYKGKEVLDSSPVAGLAM
jgi:hypothetical protein